MGNYMDRTYLAVDGVILTYSGNDEILQIPSKLMDMDIVRLGDGAFMESLIEHVIVPEGVKTIGRRTFYDCPRLSQIELPGSLESIEFWAFNRLPMLTSITINDLALSKKQFITLKQSGIPVGGTKYIVTDPSPLTLIMQIFKNVEILPAKFIPNTISRLFEAPDSNTFSESASYNCFRFGISGGKEQTEEFRNALSDINNPVDPETEKQQDELLKKEYRADIQKTAIIFLDAENYSNSGDTYYVRAEIRFGYYFWQTLLPVYHERKQYYLYRRNYLSRNGGDKYLRVDVAILNDKGLVTNREEAEEVYAKYRMLSLL